MSTETIHSENHLPSGWHISGSHPTDYSVGIDPTLRYQEKASGYIQSKPSQQEGFATLMQNIKADRYRGQRIRLSAQVKGENITGWAGLWMRVDSAQADILGFDNMENRPVTGTTDWRQVEIVLDVPESSVLIAFGYLLMGQGQAWVNAPQLEIVGAEIASTNMPIEAPVAGSDEEKEVNQRREEFIKMLPEKVKGAPTEPVNLDFAR